GAAARHRRQPPQRRQAGPTRVNGITEVQRMEADVITRQDIFTFTVESVTSNGVVLGKLTPTGLRPTFQAKFEKHGVERPLEMFQNGSVPPELARGVAR